MLCIILYKMCYISKFRLSTIFNPVYNIFRSSLISIKRNVNTLILSCANLWIYRRIQGERAPCHAPWNSKGVNHIKNWFFYLKNLALAPIAFFRGARRGGQNFLSKHRFFCSAHSLEKSCIRPCLLFTPSTKGNMMLSIQRGIFVPKRECMYQGV